MLVKKRSLFRTLGLVALGVVFAIPAFPGLAVVGSVAGSKNAMVGGQTVMSNTTLFSGDTLQVEDGAAMVTLGISSHVSFGRDTVASFQRDSNEVTVLLGQGSVSVFHSEDPTGVRVKVGDVSVVPVPGFKTLGEVATLNGAMVVTAQEGMLRVEGNGPVVNVVKGKTITVYPKANAPQNTGTLTPTIAHPTYRRGTLWWWWTDAIFSGLGIFFSAEAWSDFGNAANGGSSASSNASAATAAANAAQSAANALGSAAAAGDNAAGCALNILSYEEGNGPPSPYTPPAGESCPH